MPHPAHPGGPTVAILVPTYNRPELLAEALASIQAQTFGDWEAWVLNDGGTRVAGVVAALGDARFRYHDLPHGGVAHTLNWAIPRLASRFVAYLGDDDRFLPGHLEALVSALAESPRHRAAYSDARELRLRRQESEPHQVVESWIHQAPEATFWSLLFGNVIPHTALFHERALFDRIGLYDESLPVLVDWDLLRRMSRFTPFLHVRQVTVENRKFLDANGQIGSEHLTGQAHHKKLAYRRAYLRIVSKFPRLSPKPAAPGP
ncbi:MAG: glycosyltransferase [Cyanobacteria bacterium REEB65]|nr:glycosyltransferase [Cyanobacteria bacterium REEB65]